MGLGRDQEEADACGHGGGDQKLAKSCGSHLWMAPKACWVFLANAGMIKDPDMNGGTKVSPIHGALSQHTRLSCLISST